MKKVKIFTASLALVGAAVAGMVTLKKQSTSDILFLRNIEVLAQTEGHTTGYCDENRNECMDFCPGCGNLVYADGHQGPARNLKCCQ